MAIYHYDHLNQRNSSSRLFFNMLKTVPSPTFQMDTDYGKTLVNIVSTITMNTIISSFQQLTISLVSAKLLTECRSDIKVNKNPS
jgi:hypothetical protein